MATGDTDDPRQLNLPGMDGPDDYEAGDATTKPEEAAEHPTLELTGAELRLIQHLCETGRDFLRGKLLMNQVPEQHVRRIQKVCKHGDRVIEKLDHIAHERTKH